MRGRKQKRTTSLLWTWASFVVFGLVIALLGTSLFKQQSPVAIMKGLITSDEHADSYQSYSKKRLLSLVEIKDATVDSLMGVIASLENRCGEGLAYVRVETEALNMRSDPTVDAQLLTRIPNGSAVVILEFSDDMMFLEGNEGRWVRIEYDGLRGWVWGNYLKLRGQ